MSPGTAPRPPLAVTMGEPAGIGGEITLKAWLAREQECLPAFFALDDPDRLNEIARSLGLDVPIRPIAAVGEARSCFQGALPVLATPLAVPAEAGRPSARNAEATIGAIERAVRLCQAGEAGGIVTNPIQKSTLYEAGFTYQGHTDYLGALLESSVAPVMMLATSMLRVVPVTVHQPLRDAIDGLTTAAIVHAAHVTWDALRADFDLEAPRVAIAGLNPHAGEGGALGREEIEIVVPAIEELRAKGMNVTGPLVPDAMFHERARAGYDAAICMYHDQALIPLKTLDFENGVNITLGLGLVRTSPDHGTALDIAGQGRASAASLIQAIRMAGDIAARRAQAAGS